MKSSEAKSSQVNPDDEFTQMVKPLVPDGMLDPQVTAIMRMDLASLLRSLALPLRAEVHRLEKLVYLGEHRFDDLTYKARLEETVADLNSLRAQLAAVEKQTWEAAAMVAWNLLPVAGESADERTQRTVAAIRAAATGGK